MAHTYGNSYALRKAGPSCSLHQTFKAELVCILLTCCLRRQPPRALCQLSDAMTNLGLGKVSKGRVEGREKVARGMGAVLKVAFEARRASIAHVLAAQLPHDPVCCLQTRSAGHFGTDLKPILAIRNRHFMQNRQESRCNSGKFFTTAHLNELAHAVVHFRVLFQQLQRLGQLPLA